MFYLSVSFPSTHPIAVVITYKDMVLMLPVSSRLNSVTHHFTTHEKNHSVIGLNNHTSMCPQYVHHGWSTLGCEIFPQSNVSLHYSNRPQNPNAHSFGSSETWGRHPLGALPSILPCFFFLCLIAWVSSGFHWSRPAQMVLVTWHAVVAPSSGWSKQSLKA